MCGRREGIYYLAEYGAALRCIYFRGRFTIVMSLLWGGGQMCMLSPSRKRFLRRDDCALLLHARAYLAEEPGSVSCVVAWIISTVKKIWNEAVPHHSSEPQDLCLCFFPPPNRKGNMIKTGVHTLRQTKRRRRMGTPTDLIKKTNCMCYCAVAGKRRRQKQTARPVAKNGEVTEGKQVFSPHSIDRELEKGKTD